MSSDPHQGGRLEDMAATGTTVPGDAGKMNTVSLAMTLHAPRASDTALLEHGY